MIHLIDATQREKGVDHVSAEAMSLDEVPLRRMGHAEDFGKLVSVLVSAPHPTSPAQRLRSMAASLAPINPRDGNGGAHDERFEGADLLVQSLKALGVRQDSRFRRSPELHRQRLRRTRSAAASHPS